MRKPNMKDLFIATKIVKKLDFKKANIDTTKKTEDIGKDVILFIIENIDKVEEEITQLISNIFEVEKDKALDMPIDDIIKGFMETDGISDFFSYLKKSMTKTLK